MGALERAVVRLGRDPAAVRSIDDFARLADIDPARLDAATTHHFHATSSALLESARVDAAARLLVSGKVAVAAVADAVGHPRPGAFDRLFRARMRMSVSAFVALPDACAFTMSIPRWWRRDAVLAYLGRDPKSLAEQVEARRFRFARTVDGRAVAIDVRLDRDQARVVLASDGALPSGAAVDAHRAALHRLGLARDPRPFERAIAATPWARLLGARHGLTVPRTADAFDGLCWVIAGQQVSVPVACALRRRLIARVGQEAPGGLRVPATAAAVAALDPPDLRAMGFSRRKTEYLSDIARSVVDGTLPLGVEGQSVVRVTRRLLAIRGLGPWSVQYLLMRAYGFADCVPMGDVALLRSLQGFFGLDQRPDTGETVALMSRFAPFRSFATFHFWARLAEED